MKPLLCTLLVALLLVTPVAATVQYPEEYYTLGQQADSFSYYGGNGLGFYGTFLELRRQTILMEKQNELLQEQNELLRNSSKIKLYCTPDKWNINAPYYCEVVT